MNRAQKDIIRQARGRKRTLIVALVIGLVVIVDLIIFFKVTDRPLGLDPFEPQASPRLATRGEAGIANSEELSGKEAGVIIPAITWESTGSRGCQKYEVLGFGYKDGKLYLQVRLYESIDFSLGKGWGKAFLLIDSRGKKHIYDSHQFPNAVDIHDMFIGLPNDLRCRQTVLPGGYRDLILVFPQFPASATPASLKVVEAFQGGSPANPGITYEEAGIERTGQSRTAEAVMAMSPGEKDCQAGAAVALPGLNGTSIQVEGVVVDHSYLPRVSLKVQAQEDTSITLVDAVLAGPGGASYNMVELEKEQVIRVVGGGEKLITLTLEKLPAMLILKDCKLWLNFATPAGESIAVTLEL